METISLKALSRKVLERNLKGNSRETLREKQGNFEGKNDGECFLTAPDVNMTDTDIHKMPLSEFEKANLVLRVWSTVLKEHVYFVSSDAVINKTNLDAVAYTASELQAMLDMTPDKVKVVHQVKTVFHRARVIECWKTEYA